MEDTNESIEERLKTVTSSTKATLVPSLPSQNTKGSVKRSTGEKAEKETEEMLLQAARLLDLIRSWSLIHGETTAPVPLIFNDHIIVAFPLSGHVMENSLTSDGKQNFTVDGKPVLE